MPGVLIFHSDAPSLPLLLEPMMCPQPKNPCPQAKSLLSSWMDISFPSFDLFFQNAHIWILALPDWFLIFPGFPAFALLLLVSASLGLLIIIIFCSTFWGIASAWASSSSPKAWFLLSHFDLPRAPFWLLNVPVYTISPPWLRYFLLPL